MAFDLFGNGVDRFNIRLATDQRKKRLLVNDQKDGIASNPKEIHLPVITRPLIELGPIEFERAGGFLREVKHARYCGFQENWKWLLRKAVFVTRYFLLFDIGFFAVFLAVFFAAFFAGALIFFVRSAFL